VTDNLISIPVVARQRLFPGFTMLLMVQVPRLEWKSASRGQRKKMVDEAILAHPDYLKRFSPQSIERN
jgi:hypothetical protein